MWTILRDVLVVPALLWIAPLAGGDSIADRGHGWAASECDEDRQATQALHTSRPASGDPAPALRRHAPALYP